MKTKRYFVKYTIYDGEHEYADHVTHELDPERIGDDAYVLSTIMYLDEEDKMVEYDDRGHYEVPSSGDYRLYVLDSVRKIPKADLKILDKYGV